jgi:hypothetical protein
MESVIGFLTGIGGILLGLFAAVLVVGWLYLRRVSKKINQTT